MASKKKVGKGGIVDEFERAEAVMSKYVDEDMCADEIYELLVNNGVSPGFAAGIAQDMREVDALDADS